MLGQSARHSYMLPLLRVVLALNHSGFQLHRIQIETTFSSAIVNASSRHRIILAFISSAVSYKCLVGVGKSNAFLYAKLYLVQRGSLAIVHLDPQQPTFLHLRRCTHHHRLHGVLAYEYVVLHDTHFQYAG